MTVTRVPKAKMKDHFPGLEQQIEVGLTGVGVHVITATLAVNTLADAAALIGAPPNTDGFATCGPVVHSLGAPPTAAIPIQIGPQTGSMQGMIGYQYLTADNSAVYIFAEGWTAVGAADLGLLGVGTRITVIR